VMDGISRVNSRVSWWNQLPWRIATSDAAQKPATGIYAASGLPGIGTAI
jgi:hypothetical protein